MIMITFQLTCIAWFAVTYDLIRGVVSLTGMAIKVVGTRVSRAGAGMTVIPRAEHWVAVETFHTAVENEERYLCIWQQTCSQAAKGNEEVF